MRWLEEFELKHIEFIRTIKSFESMRAIWGTIANRHTSPGYSAFARRQSSMYADLRDDAISRFKHVGNPELVKGDTASFIQAVQDFRAKQLSWFSTATHSS
jgi:hypothetical protein